MGNSAINIVLIIIGLLLAIFVHELGHFVVAKISGVRIFEFSVGVGPKVFKKKKNDTLYVLRLLPLGGYVLVASKLLLQELSKTGEKQYQNVRKDELLDNIGPLRKIAFFLGGITMNFVFAALLAVFIDYLVYGRWVFDILVNSSFKTIGVLFDEVFTGKIFQPKNSQVTGLVASTANAAENTGFINWYFFYYLGLSLVAFNLLPIPPLDGFKILETIFVSFIYKKEVKPKVTIAINICGAAFLGIMFLLIIIGDILKIT